MKERIVILGFMSHFPVAGVAWQTIHYLIGLQRLGYDVFYVECHDCTPSKLMQSADDDGIMRAATYIDEIMCRFDLGNSWAYHSPSTSRCYGMSESQLHELYRSAAAIINLHGSHMPAEELAATNRLVYLETDPVDVEIDLYEEKPETIDYLRPHCAFFTFGERIGYSDCLVPAPRSFQFLPTRQPVVLDFWTHESKGEGTLFTTIGNWRQPWREVQLHGDVYRWSKHLEFEKFIDLPRIVEQEFELALSRSSCSPLEREALQAKGWHVRDALSFSANVDLYRRYITCSRGEFTVAKDQNVRLRSGWFSDRSATYLASGRPVITQETGFSKVLPAGEGLFAFSTLHDIVAALDQIESDYLRHSRAALAVARDYFAHDVVLPPLLAHLGISPGQAPSTVNAAMLPDSAVIIPTSRWPTRLPEETLRMASSLRIPQNAKRLPAPANSASIVIVTYGGLAYTRMCIASLLEHGWNEGDQLIIVDNASTDGTPEFLSRLSRLHPFVRVILNDANLGFAAANNQGLAIATGDVLILLNNDTIVTPGWRSTLAEWAVMPEVGAVGPVTNRTCNEAQIDARYGTYAEMRTFAAEYTQKHPRKAFEIPMLAMFCMAMRRDVFEKTGALDEQFQIGMFEDDDYARRLRLAGYRIVCAEDVFIHHFGQAAFGELCLQGNYNEVLEGNRGRFEDKWQVQWMPHGRRISPEYQRLRSAIQGVVARELPAGATVLVINKGDEELLRFEGCAGWHFPRDEYGGYPNIYPADSRQAIRQLENAREHGAGFLVIPQPALWWLDYYGEFKDHLESHYTLAVRDDDTCLIFNLRGSHVYRRNSGAR